MNPRRASRAFFKASPSVTAALVAALALSLLAYEVRGFSSVHEALADFHAFYCAGSALAHGADPYRTAALSPCERVREPWGFYSASADVVLPAPLPPYAIALFAAFSPLSYPLAALLWLAASIGAVLAAGCIYVRSMRVAPLAVAAMLLLPAAVLWLPFGELGPLALLGAVIAAAEIDRSPPAAAIGFVLLALEPHVAAAAWICAFLAAPRMRAPLAISGLALVAACAAVHPGLLAEYVREVLPVHALAELPRPSQYSAAWLLYTLGVPAAAALAGGAASAFAASIGGIALAVQLTRRWRDGAAVVFVPVALSVIGGTFVHASQIVLALPFAALVATREGGTVRTCAAFACAMLAVPWSQTGTQTAVLFAAAAVAACVVYCLCRSAALAAWSLLGAIACAAVVTLASQHHAIGAASGNEFVVPPAQRELASAEWGRHVWEKQSSASIADWAAKAPAWIALLLLVGSAARAAANKEAEAAVGVRQTPVAP